MTGLRYLNTGEADANSTIVCELTPVILDRNSQQEMELTTDKECWSFG